MKESTPKKKVGIYVNEGDWKDIRFMSLRLGVSAGDYLVDLHRSFGDEYAGLLSSGKSLKPPEIDTANIQLSRELVEKLAGTTVPESHYTDDGEDISPGHLAKPSKKVIKAVEGVPKVETPRQKFRRLNPDKWCPDCHTPNSRCSCKN